MSTSRPTWNFAIPHAIRQIAAQPGRRPQVAPAIERVISRTGRKPRTVTADRGDGEKVIDDALHDLRDYGWDRARVDGTEGARIWTGHGILAHNLVKISALAS